MLVEMTRIESFSEKPESKIIDTNDIQDAIYDELTEEMIRDYLTDFYPPINIPIVGDVDAGEIIVKLLSYTDYNFLKDDIARIEAEMIIDQLKYDNEYDYCMDDITLNFSVVETAEN